MNSIIHSHKENKALNYFLVFVTLTFATDPFFLGTKAKVVIPFLLLGFIFFKRGYKVDQKIIMVIVVVATLIILQGMLWGFSLLTIFTYTASVILVPYFLYRIVGLKVFHYLVNIIYVTSIYSLILWLFQNLFPPFDYFLQDLKNVVFDNYSFDRWARSLIFYTVAIAKAELGLVDIYRNSGIFHEPGGYAIWLIVGIGLNTIMTKESFCKKNILMSIALLTTFSTAGYLQLFVLLSFLITKSRINIIAKGSLVVLFIILSIYAFTTAEFLQKKIDAHYYQQSRVQLEDARTTGRFVRSYKIINVIQQSPFIGRGINTASAEDDKYSAYYMSGTGSLKVLAHFGLIFGSLFFLYYYRGILLLISSYNYDPQFALFFFASMFLGGFAQDFFIDAISIQFFFLGLINWSKSKKLKTNNSSDFRQVGTENYVKSPI